MKNITVNHCQQCGNTDYEDVGRFELEGYSACCNERVISFVGTPCDPRECSHR